MNTFQMVKLHCTSCLDGGTFKLQVPSKPHLKGSKGRKFNCSNCGKRFPSSRDLTRHLRTHTDEHPYEWSHCSDCFRIRVEPQPLQTHPKEAPKQSLFLFPLSHLFADTFTSISKTRTTICSSKCFYLITYAFMKRSSP